ncbi:GATA zinc finger domain-containing protein 14-like [Homarus americanus]|uniref:GATA zinc finger domain-containing protein 14-like n=1 Tax=Homarus americanus TaxID=6706 RepID=UPI001C485AE3|nr:GATA zinc finger domain-containing protein 14-like [Homarus americanus]
MKTFIIVVVAAALATGQQFQQTRDFTPAVRLAEQDFFQQTRGSTFRSVDNNKNQFQSSSFQSNNNLQDTQRDNFRSGLVDSSVSRQSGTFLNNVQFRANVADRSQFQDSSFQQNQRNTFNSNDFQQNSGSSFLSGATKQNVGNRLQVNNNQQNIDRTSQGNFNQQNAATRSQINTNNRIFQQSQFQDNAFQRSGSSFENSDDTISGVYEPLNLPSGASVLMGSISTTFNCLDRPYGYYADQDNSCRVFHVCNPALFSNGAIQTFQYSFMCGEGTVFDQKEMTCVMESSATPCQEASNYYVRNQEFGRLEDRQF